MHRYPSAPREKFGPTIAARDVRHGSRNGITAIIPADLERRPANLLSRFHGLLGRSREQGVSVVVGHNDRGNLYDGLLKRLCAYHGARIVSNAYYEGEVNNALLRNKAMTAVDSPFTVLLDADLHVPTGMLHGVAASVANGERPFGVLPCLYLSRAGTSRLRKNRTEPEALFGDYLKYKRAPFLHLALPSSVTVFRTEDFARAGGFDEAFSGHGYEDFDFLVRLASIHGQVKRTADLLVDAPTRAPLLSRGFRGQLALLALPSLLRKEVAFHLWHSTGRDDYYRARERNAKLFREKLAMLIPERERAKDEDRSAWDLSLMRAWLDICHAHRADPHAYTILFDNRPGHADRLDTPLRKLRFLLGAY